MSEHEGIWTEYRPTYWDGWSACKRMGDIVRCRDCKHATPDTSGRKYYEGYLWCDELTEGIGFSVAPSDFCAWGERGDA